MGKKLVKSLEIPNYLIEKIHAASMFTIKVNKIDSMYVRFGY